MSEEAANGFRVDRRALARAFDRAAPTYDGGAAIQRRARDELLSRLDYFALDPRCILDLGAGTLKGARALQQRYPRACVLAFDLSADMLQAAAAPAPPC